MNNVIIINDLLLIIYICLKAYTFGVIILAIVNIKDKYYYFENRWGYVTKGVAYGEIWCTFWLYSSEMLDHSARQLLRCGDKITLIKYVENIAEWLKGT